MQYQMVVHGVDGARCNVDGTILILHNPPHDWCRSLQGVTNHNMCVIGDYIILSHIYTPTPLINNDLPLSKLKGIKQEVGEVLDICLEKVCVYYICDFLQLVKYMNGYNNCEVLSQEPRTLQQQPEWEEFV